MMKTHSPHPSHLCGSTSPRWGRLSLVAALALLVPAAAHAITVKVVPGPTGVETWLSEEHALPMIAVNISLPGGSAYDPVDRTGLAALTASLLDEGAGDLNSDAFKQALESKAIKLSASAERDFVVVTLTMTTENADEAFRLLGMALAHPRFDADAVERMRASLLASLKQEEQNPGQIASKAWFASYFGTHPYARPSGGTASGLNAIKIDDIKSFAADHWVRDRAKVAVSGDITETQLRRYLQQVFLALPAKPVPAIARVADAKPGSQTLPSDQAAPVAMFGIPGPVRSDPDFIPTYVANYILGGGGFSARLMDQVRDKRGLTYGIYTALADYRSASIILGNVQSDKGKILTAIDVTKEEMAKFAQAGATAKELADAKTYLTGSFPLTFDSNAKIARNLNGFQRSGLTADYVVQRNAMINAVTLAKVNEMAKKYYDPARLTVVIAGTPAAPTAAAPAIAR